MPGSIAYNEVSTLLWEERELLDSLAFSLEMQRLVLAPGNDRWVARVCREVELALDRLRPAQMARAVQMRNLGDELGIDAPPSLRVIVETAENPWNEIFASHRRAFLDLTGEILGLAEHNRAWLADRASAMAASARRSAGSATEPEQPGERTVRLLADDR